jgi:hypothetical protein
MSIPSTALSQYETKQKAKGPARADDLVCDPLDVVAEECGFSLSTLRREIAAGRGPKITFLSERRQAVQRRHRREWLDAKTSTPTT